MNISTRILVSLAAAAVATGAGLAAGGAANANPLPPSTTLMLPVVKVQVSPVTPLLIGDTVKVTITAHWSDNSALPGMVTLTQSGPAGSANLLGAGVNASVFTTGDSYIFPVTYPGEVTFTARYAPPTGTFGSTASGSAVAHQRVGGMPSVAISLGKAVAGSPTPVSATLSLPAAGAAFPLGGDIAFQVDALGTLASCTPTRTSATAATCSSTLPGSLAVGPHTFTAIFENSPTYLTGVGTSPFAVVAAPAKTSTTTTTTKGGTSGTTVPTPAASSPAVTPVPTPSATAAVVPAPAGGDGPAPQVLPTTTTGSAVPLWGGIALAILLIAFLAIAAIVIVAIVRSRRGPIAA